MTKRGKKRTDDALPRDFWKKAEPGETFLPKQHGKKNAEKLMRGKVGRPVAETPGVRITIRLLPEVDSYFRSTGKGWQTRINAALVEWMGDRRHS